LISLAGGLLGLALATPCLASPLEEVRAGVFAHNICIGVDGCTNAGKEGGVDINVELVFSQIKALHWVFSPRPYLVGSANTEGLTSFGGGGLSWKWQFADNWAFEPQLGYVLHTGAHLDNPYPPSDPERGPFQEKYLLLGSRDLFHLSLAITHDFTPKWGAQVALEHLSHGQILGHGRNEGLDMAGIRIIRRLKD
jgi:lipid A 3-O-deacylase